MAFETIYPDYTNSLVNVPATILSHFGILSKRPSLKTPLLNNIQNCSKVVLLVADGFGYNLWRNIAKNSYFFKKIQEHSVITSITSGFPSTTAASLTTLDSGLLPREHGLFEWNLYFQEFDSILETLPFAAVPTQHHKAQILPQEGKVLFNKHTLYEKLAENSIPSYYFVSKAYSQGVYTRAVSSGATVIAYVSLTDLLIALRRKLEETLGKAYFYVYWPGIDTAEHLFGVETEETASEVNLLSYLLEKELLEKLNAKVAQDTAFLMTADHGQISVNPEETIYLNDFPQVTKFFKKSSGGLPILPTGGPRDVFLSIEEDSVGKVISFLNQKLFGIADIFELTPKIVDSFFGEGIDHDEFRNRLGNVLVLPLQNKTVWYKYLPEKKFSLRGHHGGLSRDEMEIPFVATRLDTIK